MSCMNIHWLLTKIPFGETVTEYIRKIAYQSVIKCNACTTKWNMHDKLALVQAEQACPLNPATKSHWNSFHYEWAEEGQTEAQTMGRNLWLQRLKPCITNRESQKTLKEQPPYSRLALSNLFTKEKWLILVYFLYMKKKKQSFFFLNQWKVEQVQTVERHF